MTRTNSARQLGRNPFALLPILKEARVPMSPKYTLELALYDVDSGLAFWLGWEPYSPSEAEETELSEKIAEAIEQLFSEAYNPIGALKGDAS